jgi:hypothetical protein
LNNTKNPFLLNSTLLEKYVLAKIFFVRKYDNLFETKKKDIEIGYWGNFCIWNFFGMLFTRL